METGRERLAPVLFRFELAGQRLRLIDFDSGDSNREGRLMPWLLVVLLVYGLNRMHERQKRFR